MGTVLKRVLLPPLLTLLTVFALFLGWRYARLVWFDWQVADMCRKEGGTKIHEVVRLGPDERVPSDLPETSKRSKPLPEGYKYRFHLDSVELKRGDPSINKRITQIVREKDQKVLAEYINISRSGGDVFFHPGPNSAYDCYQLGDSFKYGSLIKRVFLKE